MKFGPVGWRTLAKPVEQEMTASGIVLPPTVGAILRPESQYVDEHEYSVRR